MFSALVLAAALTGTASADDVNGAEGIDPAVPAPWEVGEHSSADFSPDLWFVELASPPAAEGTPPGVLQRELARFRAEAASENVKFAERKTFSKLWNGLSIRADKAAADKLTRLGAVSAVYPVALVDVPDSAPTADPELITALAMTGADVAGSELGLTGEGVRVAIMDTGIDYNHPDLGGGFGPGHRVETGYDFVGDDYDAGNPDAEPVPDPDPMDCNGHGTHVAGIVGADAASEDGVTGVAPGVTFGAYQVFGCEGSTTADIMIAAMEKALEDGMDVLNMSIGSAFTWPQYPTATASDRLVEQGMVVVASIGNSGADGLYSAGAPGLGEKVIGVASADNTDINALTFLVDAGTDDERRVPYMTMSDAPEPPMEGETPPLAHLGRGCLAPFDEYLDDPAGKVALIQRGECTFEEKYQRAVDAGAAAVVMYNNTPGLFAGGGIIPRDGVPAAAIDNADGTALADLAENRDDVTITWTDERTLAASPTGGLVSSFSSYGHSPDLALKPDIMAPGGLINATYPLAKGGYATISGTSMSSPHVAGTAALLMEAEPGLAADAYRDRLQNTAEPTPWSLNAATGLLDHTYRQGAGMVQIDQAVLATTGVTPGKFALGAGVDATETTLTVTNRGDEDVTYTVGHTSAIETAGSTYVPEFYLVGAGFDAPESVVVPAGGSADVTVTITPPHVGLANHQYGGYVVLVDADGNAPTLRVPYGGFAGDYQSLPIFGYLADSSGAVVESEPLLAIEVGHNLYEEVEAGHVYRPKAGEHPSILGFHGHHPQRVEVVAHHAQSGKSWTVAVEDHAARSPWAGEYVATTWDGTVPAGSGNQSRLASPGTYTLEYRALKALGDSDNPDHWETWTSDAFEIRGGK